MKTLSEFLAPIEADLAASYDSFLADRSDIEALIKIARRLDKALICFAAKCQSVRCARCRARYDVANIIAGVR